MQYYIQGYLILKSESLVNANGVKLYDTHLDALYALKDKCQLHIKEINERLLSVQQKIDDIYEDNQNNLG